MTIRLNGCSKEYIEFSNSSNIYGTHISCNLMVSSSVFQVNKKFDFEINLAKSLIAALKEFTRSPKKFESIKLASSVYEEECICFSGDSLGHIEIVGTLVQYGHLTQKLEFAFITDQTIIKDFTIEFEKLINISKA